MTSTELETVGGIQRKYRRQIPDMHRASLDTRIHWLWHQKFGTVQTIALESQDILDQTACTLILQAIMARDLTSIAQVFQRIEGGPLEDEQLLEREDDTILRV